VKTFPAVLALALPFTPPTALAQDEADPGTAVLVDEAVDRMASGDLGDVYGAVYDLAELGEAAVPYLRTRLADEDDPWVLLGCLKALVELDAVQSAETELIELAGPDRDPEIRIAAIDTLSSLSGPKVVQALVDYLDRTYDPELKVALATALFKAGEGDYHHRLRAKKELRALLESENREFRIQGALALARINDFDDARPILNEIDDQPTPEGALARAYLMIDRQQDALSKADLNASRRRAEPDANDALSVLREILDLVRRFHINGDQFAEADAQQRLLAEAARGLLASLDPHSTYFSPIEYERWLLDLNREYAGIGAYVQTIDGVFTITRPIYSGPAYRVGLRSDDKILKVDGWETYNQNQDEIIDRLKGEPGSSVTVEVFRTGWKDPREFKIQREIINIPSVFYELFPGGIGYVEVVTFGQNTSKDLLRALGALEEQGAKGFVLDLRNNPGGYLQAAKEIVGQFVGGDQKVVYTEGRAGEETREWHYTPSGSRAHTQPLVILVNDRSASASEIVSGTLRHYDRAVIVGEKTYGKGSVQNQMGLRSQQSERLTNDLDGDGMYDNGEEFEDANGNGKYDYGGVVKLTTQRYYLPDNQSIHTEVDADGRVTSYGGIEPDVAVEFEGYAPWKAEELTELFEKGVFKKYVDEHYEGNEQLFIELAEGDGFDTSRYPDFDAFFTSLDTHLEKNDIRREIRMAARDKVADARGKVFPGHRLYGDYEEDTQLQRAIVELLARMDTDPKSIPEYARFGTPAEPVAKEGEQVRNDR
jgi:carboxyl-terminal processing protease